MLLRRTLLAVLSLGGGGLRAAFELSAQLPAAFADGPVTVSRESHETKDLTPVATGRFAGGRGRVRVDAGPGLFRLSMGGEAEVAFVAGEGQTLSVEVGAGGRGLRVVGGADQELFARYEALRAESLARLVLPARAAGDTEGEVAGYRAHRRELNDFTVERLKGSAALYAASLRWDGDYRLEELAGVVGEFAGKFPGAEIARLMEERVARFRVTALGAVAPALAGPGPEGGEVSLAALRGKVVLVDFWASWCAPCRTENRNYGQLYQRYRGEGFEILAVSVDQDAAGWKAAIRKDGAGWKHLSDLSGWKTPLAARYGVTALPASFLLDRAGRIVAKDLRGQPLAAAVADALQAGR
jgi:thiol-disulfide isomerase/thioredoxin